MTIRRIKQSKEDNVFDFINYCILIVLGFIFIYPLYFIIIASISDSSAVWAGNVLFVPIQVTFEGYKKILLYQDIWVGYRNSLFYMVLGTSINLFLTIITAYPISKKNFYGKKYFMTLFVITMFFQGGLIPTYLVIKSLGMINTIWAMIIPGAVTMWNVIIMRTYFQKNIPEELWEASVMDGCRDFGYLFKIVIPLSAPVFAVIILFCSVSHWNAFFNALIYITNKELYPLQLVLREILVQSDVKNNLTGAISLDEMAETARMSESIKYGVIIIASLPVLMLYPFIQKYFVTGIMVGSVKG